MGTKSRKKSAFGRRAGRGKGRERSAESRALRHEAFLEEAARRGAAHPYGQDPLVGYLTLYALDTVLADGLGSLPARAVADKILTEVLCLPEDAPCRNDYFAVVSAIRRGADWPEVEERSFGLARALEREGRAAEAEDVFRTLQDGYGADLREHLGLDAADLEARGIYVPAEGCGERGLVRAFLGQGRTLRELERLRDAEDAFRRAREAAHRADLPDEEALARAALAGIAVRRKKVSEGRTAFEDLVRDPIVERISPDTRGSVFSEWARTVERQDPTRTLTLLWEAFEAYADPAERIRVLYELATRLLASGLYEPARRAFEILGHETASDPLSLLALKGLIEVAGRTGDALLFQRVWTALSPRLSELDPARRAESCRCAARTLRALGRHSDARRLDEQARYAEGEAEVWGPPAPPRGARVPGRRSVPKEALRTHAGLRALVAGLDSRWQALGSS